VAARRLGGEGWISAARELGGDGGVAGDAGAVTGGEGEVRACRLGYVSAGREVRVRSIRWESERLSLG
jgi:hypothetical protein